MAINILKLSVGAETVQDIIDWHEWQTGERRRTGRDPRPVCDTRNAPKRRAEVLDGGSLYWVVKGIILVRQPILDIVSFQEADGPRCEIVLARDYILTAPQPRRAFQGWRYLEVKDSPPDIAAGAGQASDLPEHLRRELIQLGAW
jgi:hypothetical protein